GFLALTPACNRYPIRRHAKGMVLASSFPKRENWGLIIGWARRCVSSEEPEVAGVQAKFRRSSLLFRRLLRPSVCEAPPRPVARRSLAPYTPSKSTCTP